MPYTLNFFNPFSICTKDPGDNADLELENAANVEVLEAFRKKHCDGHTNDKTSLEWLCGQATDYEDLVESRIHIGSHSEMFLVGYQYEWLDFYELPSVSKSQQTELNKKASDGDIVAMTMLGALHYKNKNKAMAYEYFNIACEASKKFDIKHMASVVRKSGKRLQDGTYNDFLFRNIPYVIACTVSDPVERRRYHRISIERGGKESLYELEQEGSTDRLHAIVGLANYMIALLKNRKCNDQVDSAFNDKIKDEFIRTFKKLGKKDKEEIMNVFLQYSDDRMKELSKLIYNNTTLYDEVNQLKNPLPPVSALRV